MKIGLCGTMSVGKTTLVNALKKLPQFPMILQQNAVNI